MLLVGGVPEDSLSWELRFESNAMMCEHGSSQTLTANCEWKWFSNTSIKHQNANFDIRDHWGFFDTGWNNKGNNMKWTRNKGTIYADKIWDSTHQNPNSWYHFLAFASRTSDSSLASPFKWAALDALGSLPLPSQQLWPNLDSRLDRFKFTVAAWLPLPMFSP